MTKKIAILGGGMLGATAAFYLSHLDGHENIEVSLFDNGKGQATKAAAGIISPWLSKRRNKRWYKLAVAGAELYPELVKDSGMGSDIYQRTGTIVTRKDHSDLLALYEEAKKKAQTTPAMGIVELLSAEQIKEKLPLVYETDGGVMVSGGAKIEGLNFIKHLIDISESVNLKFYQEQAALTDKGDVLTSSGVKKFDKVIVTTGAWMKETLAPLNVKLKIRPQKGQLIDVKVPITDNNQKLPVLMPESERDIIPFGDEKLVIGATHENDEGFDLSATTEGKDDLLSSAQKFIKITESDITGMRVGTRAYTEDFAPFFGKIPNYPNILIAGGLGSSGLTTGPMIGKLLAESVLSNQETDWNQYTKPVSDYLELIPQSLQS